MNRLTSHLGSKSFSRRAVVAVIFTIVVISATSISIIYYVLQSSNVSDEYRLNIKDNDPADMGVDEWLEDFSALFSYVKYNYPYLTLKNRTHGYN